MKNARSTSAIAGIILGLTMFMGPSSANPQPPTPLAELTALWWQWVYSIPQPIDENGNPVAPFNPFFDTSGAYCMVGQRGSVWFLAGTDGLSSGQVTRSCSIPEGVSLFFPVINFVNVNTPGCPPGTPNMTVQQLEAQANFQQTIDGVNSNPLSAMVDGVEVKKTLVSLVQTEPFELALPTQNVFNAIYGLNICVNNTPVAPGIYSPAVAEGYYVWLPPLPLGKHTIVFYASETSSTFFGPASQNVVYVITVVPVSLK